MMVAQLVWCEIVILKNKFGNNEKEETHSAHACTQFFFLLSLEINKIEEFENVFIYLRIDKWSP